MQLNIIYEDKDIIVCFKPSGLATQTAKLSEPDMVSLLKNYLSGQGIKNPYVGVIHRLDMPVSGLLVFAKNKKAAVVLSKQIQDGNANKDYIALCYGTLVPKNGTLTHYLCKDARTKTAKAISKEMYENLQKTDKEQVPGYKKAVLSYETEWENENTSMIKVHLETGRFHQIRAQLSAFGNPLLGDKKYGTVESQKLSMKMQIGTTALCAYKLMLLHPMTGKKLEFSLEEEYLPNWYR